MGIFDRVAQIVRAEVNSQKLNYDHQKFVGLGLTTTGAIVGGNLGKAGILAAGKGFSVGSFGLAGAGALTGLAIYEAILMITQNDTSSLPAGIAGATVGVGISASIGKIGVSLAGTTFGAGLPHLAVAGAITGLGLAGLNRLLFEGETLETTLELAIADMEEQVLLLQKAVKNAFAAQSGAEKIAQKDYNHACSELEKWKNRTKLALQSGNQELASEAEFQWRRYDAIVSRLTPLMNQPANPILADLKAKLGILEGKLREAKTQKSSLLLAIAQSHSKYKYEKELVDTFVNDFYLDEPVTRLNSLGLENSEKQVTDIEQRLIELETE